MIFVVLILGACARACIMSPRGDCVLSKTVNFVHTGQTRWLHGGSGGGSSSGGPPNKKGHAGANAGDPEDLPRQYANGEQ